MTAVNVWCLADHQLLDDLLRARSNLDPDRRVVARGRGWAVEVGERGRTSPGRHRGVVSGEIEAR